MTKTSKGSSLRNRDVLEIWNRLNQVKGVEGDNAHKVLYAKNRSIDNMKLAVEGMAFDKMFPKSKKFEEYEKDLRALMEKYATRDGKVQTKKVGKEETETLDVDFGSLAFRKERDLLEKKFKVELDLRKEQGEKYDDFLLETSKDEIKLFFIPLSIAPTTQEAFDNLFPLIKMMPEDLEKQWDDLFDKIEVLE